MKTLIILFCLLIPPLSRTAEVRVPAGIDHSPFDELLRTYVDHKGMVDYQAWSESEEDLKRLDEYLNQFAPEPESIPGKDERIASLVNAYNAFTLKLVLDNFPTKSIRLLDDPFDGERNRVGGREVSLDGIEHDSLRPLIGWKAHSMVVCAARSCPPLWNRAYTAENWEEAMRDRYRVWLAREDLNSYHPEKNRVVISKIFDWYGDDFKGGHGIPRILGRFGPEKYKNFLSGGDYKISFKEYHWGLNAQGDLGRDYKHSFLRSLF